MSSHLFPAAKKQSDRISPTNESQMLITIIAVGGAESNHIFFCAKQTVPSDPQFC